MIRVVPVVVALFLAGCGVPAPDDARTTVALEATTTITAATTTSTIPTSTVEHKPTPVALLPGTPIAQPAGFPSLSRLHGLVVTANAFPSPARVTTGTVVITGIDEYRAMDLELTEPITIRYSADAHPGWTEAQTRAAELIVLDGDIVGYELVAGTPTVHLRYAKGVDTADVWLDEAGAAIRIVEETGVFETDVRLMAVWSVEIAPSTLAGSVPAGL